MTVDVEIDASDLEQAVLHTLSTYPAQPTPPPDDAPPLISANLRITGDISAGISVSASSAAAAALASAFFGSSIEQLTVSELVDAVQESTNVIGGALKPLLHGMTTLSIPTRGPARFMETVATISYSGGEITVGFQADPPDTEEDES